MGVRELKDYSYEDYLAIDKTTPDNERYELLFGEIYMMSGASRQHQDVVGNIFFLFKTLQKEKGCKAVVAPYDIKQKCDGDMGVVQPDVMLFCGESEIPCIVCEVLSPSTAHKDKTVKKEFYECIGVKNYLIVDPINKYVDRFVLEDGKLLYDRCYGDSDEMMLECLDASVKVEQFFE
ncbi:MAG: Uma2 family endonuclease [Campylobacterales bacterium]|nr:Uma2 family endonuclease [Campylobacterales bacterium]